MPAHRRWTAVGSCCWPLRRRHRSSRRRGSGGRQNQRGSSPHPSRCRGASGARPGAPLWPVSGFACRVFLERLMRRARPLQLPPQPRRGGTRLPARAAFPSLPAAPAARLQSCAGDIDGMLGAGSAGRDPNTAPSGLSPVAQRANLRRAPRLPSGDGAAGRAGGRDSALAGITATRIIAFSPRTRRARSPVSLAPLSAWPLARCRDCAGASRSTLGAGGRSNRGPGSASPAPACAGRGRPARLGGAGHPAACALVFSLRIASDRAKAASNRRCARPGAGSRVRRAGSCRFPSSASLERCGFPCLGSFNILICVPICIFGPYRRRVESMSVNPG